jgi:hypothetical protein
MNAVQEPGLNPASNPGPMVEPLNPLSTAPMQGSWNHFNALWDDLWWYKPGVHVSQPNTPVDELMKVGEDVIVDVEEDSDKLDGWM